MSLRVAGYQMAVRNDVEANVQALLDAIDHASEERAEILLTPEGSLSGYTHVFDAEAVRDGVDLVTRHARERGIGLALGTCFIEDDGKCYNQIRFYLPTGDYLGFHSKTLCCGTMEAVPQGELNHYAVSDLRVFSWHDDTCIGGLVCNDMWANPACTPMPDTHLSQQLSALGARIVFHAVHGGRDGSDWSELVWHYHTSNLRMRARAGGLWIVTVDNASPMQWPCSAPSGVIDPSGQFVCRTEPNGEQFFVYNLVLD